MKLLGVTDIFECVLLLYVPVQRGRDSGFEERLTKYAGGFTIQQGWGCWRDPLGENFQEEVNVYQVHCHRASSGAVQEAMEQEVSRLLDAGEQAVLLVKDGNGKLYSYLNPFK